MSTTIPSAFYVLTQHPPASHNYTPSSTLHAVFAYWILLFNSLTPSFRRVVVILSPPIRTPAQEYPEEKEVALARMIVRVDRFGLCWCGWEAEQNQQWWLFIPPVQTLLPLLGLARVRSRGSFPSSLSRFRRSYYSLCKPARFHFNFPIYLYRHPPKQRDECYLINLNRGQSQNLRMKV